VPKLVYDFAEGGKDMRDLLGGKGANLAEMTEPGAAGARRASSSPRRPATAYLRDGELPQGLDDEVAEHLAPLEAAMGKRSATPTTRCW
jgi:pyruvate,orthophosphate dikinase